MKPTLGCAIVAVSLLLLASPDLKSQSGTASTAAQAQPKASARTIPRTPDGKPDMQGNWTNQTFTPLERPAQFKDKQFFTAEEAKAFAERALEDVRDVPRGEEVKSDADIHYDDGIWLLEGYEKGAMLRTSIINDPPDGRIPALSAEGQKRNQARAAARKGIGPFDSAQARGLSERCIYWAHEGPPILPTGYNNNLQIVQSPGEFVIIPEMMPVARVAPFDGRPHIGTAIRNIRGDSRAWWDGDTLVIETTNFTDRTAFRGSSEYLKVTERLTYVDTNTIRYQFTVEDPHTWDTAWTGEYPMKRTNFPMYEYACHEGNYGMANILRAQRMEEEKARQ